MKNLAFMCAVLALLSGCVTSTAIQTGHAPTPAELQAQVQADLAALQAIGCTVSILSQAAQPIVTATVDADGQRIAQAVDQTSGRVCQARVATVQAAQ
ncbi:MAG: hypothetical protein F8N15_00430 [Methanobacterium sp.]|nr:hypothetical protein [Methanobacterium sp.]